jgi:hypothetical protein
MKIHLLYIYLSINHLYASEGGVSLGSAGGDLGTTTIFEYYDPSGYLLQTAVVKQDCDIQDLD